MTYLNVGTDYIYPELIIPVRNTKRSKPAGGFWATEQQDFYTYNPWIEHLCENPGLLFRKEQKSPWKQKGTLFTLKESANIYNLNTEKNLLALLDEYYDHNLNCIDYEKLANYYDGFFINYNALLRELKNPELIKIVNIFSISSLCLFNIEAISSFKSALIDIEPFVGGFNHEIYYDIMPLDQNYKIEHPQEEVLNIINKIIMFIRNHDIAKTEEGIEIIKETFANELAKAIEMLKIRHEIEDEKAENLLILKSFQSI